MQENISPWQEKKIQRVLETTAKDSLTAQSTGKVPPVAQSTGKVPPAA